SANGTGAETTSYSYSWRTTPTGTTAQIQAQTVSRPVVSAAQNGPGTPDVETTVFDVYGRPTWHRDPDGFLTFTGYDQATGAVLKTITDVDTTRTYDLEDRPL